jgi:hypothetical protein
VDAETEEEEEAEEGIAKHDTPSVNIIVRVSTVPENAAFKSGGSFKIYEDQVKSDANAMQVLDDTGKV